MAGQAKLGDFVKARSIDGHEVQGVYTDNAGDGKIVVLPRSGGGTYCLQDTAEAIPHKLLTDEASTFLRQVHSLVWFPT